MLNKILIGLGILFVAAAALIFRPVPMVTEDKAITETGVVKAIFEGGVHDIVFYLEDNDRRFYINRGLERGLGLRICVRI
ncbi:MAG: hypothetical protein R3B47_07620 [Bacteroidia bacterium]